MTEDELKQKFPQMTPVKSAPTLFLFNGCGLDMRGTRDEDEKTGTYVSTWCLCLVFIPILALRAYRVIRTQRGGWIFLGREPLSGFSKSWNFGLVSAILLTIAGVWTFNYLDSPEYKAKQQMAAADRSVSEGRLGEAATIYRTLIIDATPEADHALTAIKQLLDEKSPEAPLAQSQGVVQACVELARRGIGFELPEIAEKGRKLVASKGESDPRAGVAILDAIQPLLINSQAAEEMRLKLLKKWVANEPNNLDAIVPLASMLEQSKDLDGAEKLLTPVKDQLGDGEGARVYGTILASKGDVDGAYPHLWKYVSPRLDRLHASEKNAEDVIKRLYDKAFDELRNNKAPPSFYRNYENAGKDQQNAMVQEYINSRIKNNPDYTRTQGAFAQDVKVVPYAIDLGIVMLQRAQKQSDAAIRKSQLEGAEKVFLAINGVAGESDVYRLTLGQVYYWLGKHQEGHKLFEEYLASKGRKPVDLYAVARQLRSVGANDECRKLLEEAYTASTDPEEKYRIASLRSVAYTDLEDQIAWLNRCNTAEPSTKASLAVATGDKHFSEGRDSAAAEQYQEAIVALSAMPRSEITLNQIAIAQYGVFRVTGDKVALDRVLDSFQQACDLDPTDTVLIHNAGATMLNGSLTEIISADADLRSLHQIGTMRLLAHLYKDQAGRDALVKKLKAHTGINRALAQLEKLVVLAPKDLRSYSTANTVYRFMRDNAAVISLHDRFKASGVEHAESLAEAMERVKGTKDEIRRKSIASSIRRGAEKLASARAKGGITAAIALCDHANTLIAGDLYGEPVNPDEVVSLTDEAFKLVQSDATRWQMITSRCFRACKSLSSSDAEFAVLGKQYYRSIGPFYLAATALNRDSLRTKVLQHPDMVVAIEQMKDEVAVLPDNYGVKQWPFLRVADPALAATLAKNVAGDPGIHARYLFDHELNPFDVSNAMDLCWIDVMLNNPDAARKVHNDLNALGIPIPAVF